MPDQIDRIRRYQPADGPTPSRAYRRQARKVAGQQVAYYSNAPSWCSTRSLTVSPVDPQTWRCWERVDVLPTRGGRYWWYRDADAVPALPRWKQLASSWYMVMRRPLLWWRFRRVWLQTYMHGPNRRRMVP